MPDINGVLTQEERTKIDAWYQANWIHRNCPVCGNRQFNLADHVVMPMIYSPYVSINGTQYPQIMTICQRCGLTLYFNAITVGVIGGR